MQAAAAGHNATVECCGLSFRRLTSDVPLSIDTKLLHIVDGDQDFYKSARDVGTHSKKVGSPKASKSRRFRNMMVNISGKKPIYRQTENDIANCDHSAHAHLI